MELKLLGKKVFVTGSTSGIGLAIAQNFNHMGVLLRLILEKKTL